MFFYLIFFFFALWVLIIKKLSIMITLNNFWDKIIKKFLRIFFIWFVIFEGFFFLENNIFLLIKNLKILGFWKSLLRELIIARPYNPI